MGTIRYSSSQKQEERGGGKKHSRRAVAIVNAVVLLITFLFMYFFFTHLTQNIVFDVIMRQGIYYLPWVLLALGLYWYNRRHHVINKNLELTENLGKHRRPTAVIVTLAVFSVIWDAGVYVATDYIAYSTYANDFKVRQGLIPSAPQFIRYTPLHNACTDIGNSVSATGEHIDCEYVQPMITGHGFGYVAPITPSGLYNTFFGKNPGFLVLDDSASVNGDPGKRLVRIDEPQAIGQSMEWFDNLDLVLARNDFFANYDTPHFLALDPAQPGKLTLVVPKIKYGWFFLIPYWGGVVLVHADGTIEDLTAEEVRKDKRLIGKWTYPLSLARYYVHLQNYAAGHGVLTPFVRMSGLLEIEELESDNQFPFLTQGNDSVPYLVTATKGQGSAKGLFRMYYIDASTGVGTYHQFGSHEVVYGAGTSAARITNIPGYQWNRGAESQGSHVAIEPVYIVRPNDPSHTMYWKYTITNISYSGISATAVANSSRPDEVHVFTDRADFEAWLQGGDSVRPVSEEATGSTKENILRTVGELSRQLDELKRQAESLPQ